MGKSKGGTTLFQEFIKNNINELNNEINLLIKDYPQINSLESITLTSKTEAEAIFKLKTGFYVKTEIRKCKINRCISELKKFLDKYFSIETPFQKYLKNNLDELKCDINNLLIIYPDIDSLETIILTSNKTANVKFNLKSGKYIEIEIKRCSTDKCIKELKNSLIKTIENKEIFEIYIENNLESLKNEINTLIVDYPYIDSLVNITLISKKAANVKFKLKTGKIIETEIRKCTVNNCIKDINNYLTYYFMNNQKLIEKDLVQDILTNNDYNEIENRINNILDDKRIHIKISKNVQVYYDTKKVYTKSFFDLINLMDYFELKFSENKKETILKKPKEKMYTSISKKLKTKLKNVNIDVPKENKIVKEAEKIYNDYKLKNNTMLNTKQYKTKSMNCSHSLLDLSELKIDTKEFKIINSENELQIKYKPSFKKYCDIVNSDLFQRASTMLKNYIKNSEYNFTEFKGLGFWFGSTTFLLSNSKWEQAYSIEIDSPYSEKMNVDDWINDIKFKITSKIVDIERKIEEKRKRIYKQTAKYRNSFLARDIVSFIKKNEEYITENAVIQYMRGNTVQLNTVIHDLPDFIPYKNYTKDEISEIINSLVNSNIIEEWEYKGTYGIFYTLHLANNNYKQVLLNVNETDIAVDPFSKTVFTDFEAEKIFFDYEKKIHLAIRDYIMLFNLNSSKGFLIRYYDEYISILQNAPKEVKKLWKMKIDMEQDKFIKKFLKEIIKTPKVHN